jgi:hypothetical protein
MAASEEQLATLGDVERALMQPGQVRIDAKSAQKLDQLQPFVAVFPQECAGQLASFGPT